MLSRKLYDELEPRLFEETGKRIGYGGDGGLVVAFEEADVAQLETMVRSQVGDDFPAQLLNREDARTREPGLPDQVAAARRARFLPTGFSIPRIFTAVIAEAARKKGVMVREETPASGLIWSGRNTACWTAGRGCVPDHQTASRPSGPTRAPKPAISGPRGTEAMA